MGSSTKSTVRGTQLRLNFGSHAVIKRVFAFDARNGIVLALVQYDGQNYQQNDRLAQLEVNELEAVDRKGKYADLLETLRNKAEFTLE